MKKKINKMKKVSALLIIGMFFIFGCQQKSTNSNEFIIGSWNYIYNSSRQDYSLTLELVNDTLKGSHCFVANNGNKIDCAEESDFTITCKKRNDNFTGKFHSTYTNNNYNITLEFINDTLVLSLDNYSDLFFSKELKFIKAKN